MRVNIVKSKNAEQVYIIKSLRINGKSTSKIIAKLGSIASLLPRFDNDRNKVIQWANLEAKKLTKQEQEGNLKINLELSESIRNEKNKVLSFNCGYLFLKKIYSSLNIKNICDEISKNYKFNYDLSDVLSHLLYARILSPSSKRSSFEFCRYFIENISFDLQHIYRSLDILCDNSDYIQSQLYSNSLDTINRNTSVLYYDCTNYFFEIENERGMCKYGKSKEHRPNPIISMGLFLDGDGLPLAFDIFDGNKNEQSTLKPLESKIMNDYKLSKLIVCTDAGLSSTSNRIFNNNKNRAFIVTQPIKKLNKTLKKYVLSDSGWKKIGSTKIYNINDNLACDDIFYKERWIKENGLEQRLIVTYSNKYKEYQTNIRNNQISRAKKIIENNSKLNNQNSPYRFIKETNITKDGEFSDIKIRALDNDKIEYEAEYDGFYAICTTLEDDVSKIISINKQRWQIESAFRTMKSEFKARPVFLQNDNRIKAHFLTCFLSLFIAKLLEKKLKFKYSLNEIIGTLRNMNLHKIDNVGYISSYTRTDLTDDLHEVFNFNTDTEFISEKRMKKILKLTSE